jgi:ATP-dependent Clp protease ATP-binding subunit ClpA
MRRVEDPLAMAILEGRFSSGETVKIGLHGEEIIFTVATL